MIASYIKTEVWIPLGLRRAVFPSGQDYIDSRWVH